MKSGSKRFLKFFVEFSCFECFSSADFKFREGQFLKKNPERGRPGNNSWSAGFLSKRSFGVHFETVSTVSKRASQPLHVFELLLWKFGASRWHHGTKVITTCYWTVNLEAALSRQETLTVEQTS